jgi:hypothetical protein
MKKLKTVDGKTIVKGMTIWYRYADNIRMFKVLEVCDNPKDKSKIPYGCSPILQVEEELEDTKTVTLTLLEGDLLIIFSTQLAMWKSYFAEMSNTVSYLKKQLEYKEGTVVVIEEAIRRLEDEAKKAEEIKV